MLATFFPKSRSDTILWELAGEINAQTAPVLKNEFNNTFSFSDKKFFILDFNAVSFLNSAGINLLLEFIKKGITGHKNIFLTGLRGQIRDIINLVGINEIVPVFDYPGAALNAINALEDTVNNN